ncbi:GBP3 isoform 7, partial [Pan troglodytes]
QDEELDPEFVQQVADFCSYIFSNSKTKTLSGGIKAEEILQTYLKSKESVTDAILQTDQILTEKEKEIEVERVKAESAQASAEMVEEMQIKYQQMMEEKEKSYQEHVKQLTEKMERERAQLLEEQEKTLTSKLQVSKC